MKKLVILIVFCGSFIFGDMGTPVPGEWEAYSNLNEMLWKTNLTKDDVEFVKTSIYYKHNYYNIGRAVHKVIASFDVVEILPILKKHKKWYKGFFIDYLESKDKMGFLKKKLSKKMWQDEQRDEGQDKTQITMLEVEYFRNSIHSVLISKQIRYNKINKKYSEHIIKDILSKIKRYQYGISDAYSSWLYHKKKAKDKNWPIADENGK